jgi:PhzF family phenazine biosynthesis protein
MPSIPFQQVDVFTSVPFRGNPVAVVLDGDRFSTEEAQAIAAWTNLSETTFVCTPTHPEADYRLRIFTPRAELPFAGHPTVGSAHAVLRNGLMSRAPGKLVQECGRGLIRLRVQSDRILFALPERTVRTPTQGEAAQVAGVLGVDPASLLSAAIVDVGPVWFTVQLPDARTVLEVEPDLAGMVAGAPPGVTGVTIFGRHPEGGPAELEVRSFAPAHGVPEDPVCGSGNGCVAVLVQQEGILPGSGYRATQGRRMGRDGLVHVEFERDGSIWLGGDAVTCVEGRIAG